MKTIYVERLFHNAEKDVWEWRAEEENFDTEADFHIDEANLEKELCRMSMILVRYGTIAGELQANLKRKEEHAKFVQARISGYLRSKYEAAGQRATEGKIMEEVIVHSDYQAALAQLHLLRAESMMTDHWYRSAIKKADILNALAFRQNAELRRAYNG